MVWFCHTGLVPGSIEELWIPVVTPRVLLYSVSLRKGRAGMIESSVL